MRAADFEAARKGVSPSTPADSFGMEELRQWAAQYGEGGDRARANPALSYFI